MNAKNRSYLVFREYGKPQLYGRALKSVQVALQVALKSGLGKLYSTKTE
jgi:hypothetical protein